MRHHGVMTPLLLALGLLQAHAADSTAPVSAREDSCRDRYETGSPAEIRKACGECLEYVSNDALCRRALELLAQRPKLKLKTRSAESPTDAMRSSQQRYLSGMIYYQKGDYEKARKEWKLSVKLDSANDDARAGLERIDKLFGK